MVRRVYAHFGTVRHRADVVESRIEPYAEVLKDRLRALGFITAIGTTDAPVTKTENPGDAKA